MYHKPNHVKIFLTIAAVFSIAVIACKKNAVIESLNEDLRTASANGNSSLEANGNSPAAHIAASESLIIPASVSVPENLPYGNTRVSTYYAVGVQKYKAKLKQELILLLMNGYLLLPGVTLYDITNAEVGNHGVDLLGDLAIGFNFAQHQSSQNSTK
jgi:hypothetical protein